MNTIERPIAATLARERLQDRILFIVLTKGIPLRIVGTAGLNGTVSSVNSELTLLYRHMVGYPTALPGRIDNPYYLGTKEIREAKPFTHREHDIYLVTRLDAFTVEQALGLVDKAKLAVSDGRIVLDQRAALVNRTGEDWLEVAAKRLADQGHRERVVLETTSKGARDISPVLGYYSWGSNNPGNRARTFGMGFVPGSLAATFVSTDARTFREPPASWMPSSDWNASTTWHEGSPQSLTGDLIRQGAAGVSGHVAEPYLQSAVRPEILFPAYVAGFTLVESFFLSIPHLSWQAVIIGDPLCAPFPRRPPPSADIDIAIDTETQLPALFAQRRLARGRVPGVPDRAVTLSIRAESLMASGDDAGARAALEQATELAPRLAGSQLMLALLYERTNQHRAAMDRYRRVLEVQPNLAVALNNLAYGLAVRDNAPAEALPLAKRALAAAPNDPTIQDTLAWVYHLLDDNLTAAKLIAGAARRAPANAEIRLHVALINGAVGAWAVAETELKEALRLDPALASRDDVRQLRAKIDQRAPAR